MTDQELKDIVAAVVAELEKSGVDFDYKAKQAEDDDLVFVIRGTAPNYQGVTVTWKGLLDIITSQATQAKNDAVTAKNSANTILEQVKSNGTAISNFVATSKTEIETQKNESVNAVKSVYQTDLNELKGDLAYNFSKMKIVSSTNMIDVTKMVEGIVESNGSIDSTSTAYKTSQKMKVQVGDTVYFYKGRASGVPYPHPVKRILTFDRNGNVFGSLTQDVESFTILEGIDSIVISVEKTNLEYGFIVIANVSETPSAMIDYFNPYYVATNEFVSETIDDTLEQAGMSADAKAVGDAIKKNIVPATKLIKYNLLNPSEINIFDGVEKENGYVNASGNWSDSASYQFTGKIDVSEGLNLKIYNKGNDVTGQLSFRFVCAYDSNGNVMKDKGSNIDISEYIVPSGVKTIIVSFTSNVSAENCMIIQNVVTKPSEVIPYNPSDILTTAGAIHAYLPKDLYCAVGRTIEVYNSQVVLECDKYHIQWDCLIGKALKRKFSVTARDTQIGDYYLACNVFDDNRNIVWQGKTTLHIVAKGTNSKTICPIGDSLSNDKDWLPEVESLSNGAYSFVGTYPFSKNDSNGNTQTGCHEGRSGFSAQDYIDGTPYTFGGATETSHNKFYNPTTHRFDWNYYKDNSSVNPDAVQIFLGTNRISLDNTQNAEYIKQIVDYIRQDDATIPIFIVNTIYKGNQNGIGNQQSNDGYASLGGQWKYNEDLKVLDLMKRLDLIFESYSNVEMINLAITHDSEFNFGKVETPVNPRAEQTELLPSESVHPQPQGYYQMADTIFSVYSAVLG